MENQVCWPQPIQLFNFTDIETPFETKETRLQGLSSHGTFHSEKAFFPKQQKTEELIVMVTLTLCCSVVPWPPLGLSCAAYFALVSANQV